RQIVPADDADAGRDPAPPCALQELDLLRDVTEVAGRQDDVRALLAEVTVDAAAGRDRVLEPRREPDHPARPFRVRLRGEPAAGARGEPPRDRLELAARLQPFEHAALRPLPQDAR